jgi:hypothetical protein
MVHYGPLDDCRDGDHALHLVALILARLPTYLQHTASVTLHLVPDHQQIFSACQVGGGRMIARLSCGSSKIMLEVTEDRFGMRMSG